MKTASPLTIGDWDIQSAMSNHPNEKRAESDDSGMVKYGITKDDLKKEDEEDEQPK
jgi:hypothetical protein